MFIQTIQAKCTHQDDARAMGNQWEEQLSPGATGWLGGTYGFTDDDMFVGVIRFDSREAAMANSARPEQGAWWAAMEKCFDGPVEFHDSDDITVMLDGGSDEAGFVQVMRGRVSDPARLKAMMTSESDSLREMRPDILGATLAIEGDGTFTETIAFTNEADARKYEQSAQMPDEMRREWNSILSDVKFMDLHNPWFTSRG